MKHKLSLLLAALLLLIHAPRSAQAFMLDEDTPQCGNNIPRPYPWWWNKVGLPDQITVRNWDIIEVGQDFVLSFDVINASDTILREGTRFTVTHAAVDAVGYANPSALTAPADAQALLGTELITQVTLPTLAAGQSFNVRARASGFSRDANHVLTLAFHDNGMRRFTTTDPIPVPWFWLRVLKPDRGTPNLRTVSASAEPVTSTLPGYTARRVTVTLANAGSDTLREGTTVSMVHSNAAAVGYWSPEDDKDPNDPGNPYAIVFREVLAQVSLTRAVAPGGTFTVEGTAHLPQGATTLQQVTVRVGP